MAGRRALWITALLVWTVAVCSGLCTLWSYETSPGPAASAPARWPEGSRLGAPHGRPALVLALHPQCPCSRATIAELARLLAHRPDEADVYALVVAAPGFDETLIQSDLWRAAAAIPGVHVMRDDGTEAHQFGARVSGQVLAYGADGRLAFNGGITGSRGHEGDNPGRSAVEAMLGGQPHRASAFVFGCLLFDGDGAPTPLVGPLAAIAPIRRGDV